LNKPKNYNDEDIIRISKQVKSMAGLLKALGLKPVGGNYSNMKRKLQKLNLNCEHWTGQLWSKGERLKDWSNYTKAITSKTHLIKERGHKCETCHNQFWLNKLIVLEIHHIDGNKTNNEYDNLKLLCPNCHSCTDNWRNRK
jgi:5-methylcytosine-specific restriction endonuclease McrA